MDPKHLTSIERWNWLFAAIFIAVAAVWFAPRVALGVAVGALLSSVNFYSLHRLIVKSARVPGRRKLALQLLLVAKMGLILALIFLAMRFLPVSPIAMAVGLSVFLLSIAVESFRFAMSEKVDDGRA